MDTAAYLKRIDYRGSFEPVIDTLTVLHRLHMYAVPFENLDIHLETPIVLDYKCLYEKIVGRNRGGFCYELNGMFGWLLSEMGFEVEMLSARVNGADGNLGPDFDHMLLRVNREFIADVGFGDSFTEPLNFNNDNQEQSTGTYRLTEDGGLWRMDRDRGEGPKPQYIFDLTPRGLNEFAEMCHYQQNSPESIFTQKSVCSMATPDGRITISNGKLIETRNGKVRERMIADESEYRELLVSRFGIGIEGGIGKLMDD